MLNPRFRLAYAILAAAETFALVTMLVLLLGGSGGTPAGVGRAILGFFIFFTNVANLLVAVAAWRLAVGKEGFFARPRLSAAITTYIVIVFALYELLIRYTWNPTGLLRVYDTIVHDLSPIAWTTLWWLCLPKTPLRYRDAALWLILPAIYGLWIALLGALGFDAPYSFLNLPAIGAARLTINLAGLLLVFWVVGLACVWVAGFRPSIAAEPKLERSAESI